MLGERFRMAEQKPAARRSNSTKRFDQPGFRFGIEIDEDVAAEDGVERPRIGQRSMRFNWRKDEEAPQRRIDVKAAGASLAPQQRL